MKTAPYTSTQNNGTQEQDVSGLDAPVSIIRFQAIAPAQLRAARSLLDWSRKDLASASGVSPETIKNIEHGVFNPQDATLKSLFETFARHGVEFFSITALNLVGVVLAVLKEHNSEDVGQS